jgi:WD40 repeat protein
VLEGHSSWVICLQALPDGRIISGSRDNTIRIWSRESSGTWSSEVLEGHSDYDYFNCLQALPDGRIISGSGDNTIRIWDGDPIATDSSHGGKP